MSHMPLFPEIGSLVNPATIGTEMDMQSGTIYDPFPASVAASTGSTDNGSAASALQMPANMAALPPPSFPAAPYIVQNPDGTWCSQAWPVDDLVPPTPTQPTFQFASSEALIDGGWNESVGVSTSDTSYTGYSNEPEFTSDALSSTQRSDIDARTAQSQPPYDPFYSGSMLQQQVFHHRADSSNSVDPYALSPPAGPTQQPISASVAYEHPMLGHSNDERLLSPSHAVPSTLPSPAQSAVSTKAANGYVAFSEFAQAFLRQQRDAQQRYPSSPAGALPQTSARSNPTTQAINNAMPFYPSTSALAAAPRFTAAGTAAAAPEYDDGSVGPIRASKNVASGGLASRSKGPYARPDVPSSGRVYAALDQRPQARVAEARAAGLIPQSAAMASGAQERMSLPAFDPARFNDERNAHLPRMDISLDWRFESCNEPYARLIGVKREDLIRTRPRMLDVIKVIKGQPLYELMSRTVQGEILFNANYLSVRNDSLYATDGVCWARFEDDPATGQRRPVGFSRVETATRRLGPIDDFCVTQDLIVRPSMAYSLKAPIDPPHQAFCVGWVAGMAPKPSSSAIVSDQLQQLSQSRNLACM